MDLFAGWPGEMIADPSNWLGDFASEYAVPFGLSYPTGWTNCTWYELNGCDVARNGCTCSDCCGSHNAILFSQRQPQDLLDPCLCLTGGLDGFQYAIAPKHCQSGCNNCRGPGLCCCSHPCDSVRCGHSCGGAQTYACWPLVSFGLANPSSRIGVVSDSSGPPELSAMNALELDFSGAGAEGATFVGKGGGYDTARCGVNSSNPPPTDFLKNFRSATGFTVNPGDCLQFSAWVKAVPDRFGYTCVGYNFRAGLEFRHLLGLSLQNFGSLILDGTWQQLTGSITYSGTNVLVNPLVHLGTTNSNRIDPRVHCADPTIVTSVIPPRGRVHIKAVHLAPCFAAESVGAHVWKRL